jgi:anti-sigma factor RsiW
MTPKFDPNKDSRHNDAREMDSLQRDRFELLSAYLDGEVTAAERKQVQDWLANDAGVQRQYAQLMNLHQKMQTLPVPPAEQAAPQMAQQVFARLDRQRFRRVVVWGGSAIAALFLGTLSVIIPGSQSPAPQLAKSPTQTQAGAEPLMVALNAPPVEIPKAAVAPSEKSLQAEE